MGIFHCRAQAARMTDCGPETQLACYDKVGAFHLKVTAIAVILTASTLGVLLPIHGQRFTLLRTDGNIFFITKAFAAGVILATGFVHMLPDAAGALTSSCLPDHPWSKFPFFGFFAMVAALATLLVDFGATEFYERLQSRRGKMKNWGDAPVDAGKIAINACHKCINFCIAFKSFLQSLIICPSNVMLHDW